jgi:hypothetical protein
MFKEAPADKVNVGHLAIRNALQAMKVPEKTELQLNGNGTTH